MTDINTMSGVNILGYVLTRAELQALTADQLRQAIGDDLVIRCPDGNYIAIDSQGDWFNIDYETRILREL